VRVARIGDKGRTGSRSASFFRDPP